MSTRQQGNVFENKVCEFLESEGYWTMCSRGSRGIDIVALMRAEKRLPHLGIEAGTKHKRAAGAFRKIREGGPLFPGMVPLVARKTIVKARIAILWHVEGHLRGMLDFYEAIERARAA